VRMFILASITFFSYSAYGKPILVPITFIEALDSKDTTSSERFRKEYETAINYGLQLTKTELARCGYELSANTSFYGASDPIQAKEKSENAQKQGAWLIVGPRRSNHYLLAVKGAKSTPTVSLMASSDEVATLGSTHLSLVPTNSVMAKEAAKEINLRLKGKTNKSYISIVREDCLYCRGFSKQFNEAAGTLGLKESTNLLIVGNEPDMSPIIAAVKKYKPSFVFIPNYSIVTGYLITKIQAGQKGLIFVGGDGWGTEFGFVGNGRDIEDAKGFTVRGNPPIDIGLRSFGSGKRLLADKSKTKLSSASALALLKTIDSTKRFLCSVKAANKQSFVKLFEKNGARYFSAPWGTSIYDLSQGNIAYKKSTGAM